MARSIFNGRLTLEGLTLPVKLYAAVEPRPVSFRLLHRSDRVPIRQRMVHPGTGEEVPREGIQKALPRPHKLVLVRPEELAALEPPPSRDIEILRFVEPARLDHQWYVRPYYLGPASAAEAGDYFALARALRAEGKQGIVRWTMRKKAYRGALRAEGDYLSLISLRAPAELLETHALPKLAWPEPSEQELNMARQLIAMLSGELDLDQFHDRYAEQVEALAEAKAEGRGLTPAPPSAEQPAPAPSLSEALAASIAQIEERSVA